MPVISVSQGAKIHVHDSPGHSRLASDWRFTDLALQFRVGILPERRTWPGSCDRAGVGFVGQSIGRGVSASQHSASQFNGLPVPVPNMVLLGSLDAILKG
jgi:hypothetical protein